MAATAVQCQTSPVSVHPTAARSDPKADEWWIGLEGWVLQDGNYTDFVTGETRQFALECSYDRGNRLKGEAGAGIACRYTGSGTAYEVEAEVLRVNNQFREDAYVVDFGLRAYTCELLTKGMKSPRVGERVFGSLHLFVDYFEYFERLGQLPGMPGLIYTWTVEEIQMDTTPRVAVDRDDPRFPIGGPYEGPELIRDMARERAGEPLTRPGCGAMRARTA